MYFDGKAGGSRTVDLGGRRRDRDREEFLSKMTKQRGERAEERLKKSSAMKIQRSYRGYRARNAMFDSWTVDLDKKVADIQKLEAVFSATGKPFSVPLDILRSLCRLFAFLSSRFSTDTRLNGIQDLIRKSTVNVNPSANLMHAITSSSDSSSSVVASWKFLVVVKSIYLYFTANMY